MKETKKQIKFAFDIKSAFIGWAKDFDEFNESGRSRVLEAAFNCDDAAFWIEGMKDGFDYYSYEVGIKVNKPDINELVAKQFCKKLLKK